MARPRHKLGLEVTAYHEAGHTFIAWLCGHEIKDLTIKPDLSKGWAGSMRHREADFDPLFDGPFPLVPNPDAPGQNLVRIEGTKARHLTQGEGRYFELVENLSDVSPNERDVMICVAGELAQRKFAPGTFEDYMAETDWEDAFESWMSLAEEQGVDPLEIRANVADRVNKLLGDPWVDCAVRTLATELLERETIPGSEIVVLLRSVFVERDEPCNG